MSRKKLIVAAHVIEKLQEELGVTVKSRGGAYGSSYLVIADNETGEEISYDEAVLLQPAEEGGE